MIPLLLLLGAPVQEASDWYALLQNRHTWECSADWIVSGEAGSVLADGLPLAGTGQIPAGLPWPDGDVSDPLESGIWGGGRWNTSISDGSLQDTMSFSRIGLIQNTLNRSRYAFELDRPLPWRSSGNFEMLRDDTLSLHSALISRGPFDLRMVAWEGTETGWGGWTTWRSGSYYARAGFSRLYTDDRRPELLSGFSLPVGGLAISGGACGAWVDSTIEYRFAGGLEYSTGNVGFRASADYSQEETGYWGGVLWDAGPLSVSGAWSDPGGDEAFQTLAVRGSFFNLVSRFSSIPCVAADIEVQAGFARGKAAGGWFTDNDSLSLNCHVLMGFDWYRGRFEAGPRVRASKDGEGEWETVLDGLVGFTLLPFSLAAGVEDVTDDLNRSWSFGITWGFTDRPPQPPEGEEVGREG